MTEQQCMYQPIIPTWDCENGNKKGVYMHDGFIYVNLIDDNTDDPAIGTGKGTVKGGFTLLDLIVYVASSHDIHDIHAATNGTDESDCCDMVKYRPVGFPEYIECDSVYNKGDVVYYGDDLFESLTDNNEDSPVEGTGVTPATWRGGYSFSAYLQLIKTEG